jgi:hypothetical protein
VATYTTETVTSTVHRWIVPAGEPWGAPAEEISKAWAAAAAAYREAHGIDEEAPLPGDAFRFKPRDEDIVIEFTTEARAN